MANAWQQDRRPSSATNAHRRVSAGQPHNANDGRCQPLSVPRFPAYYSYTAPVPDGLVDQPLKPAEAAWNADAGTAVLAYDVVRTAAHARDTLLDFFQSAYLAGARTAGWNVTDLATRAAPRHEIGSRAEQ